MTISPALKVVAREKIDCINQQLEVSPHYKFTPDHLCELTPVLKKFCTKNLSTRFITPERILSKSYNIHQHELYAMGLLIKSYLKQNCDLNILNPVIVHCGARKQMNTDLTFEGDSA